MDMQLKKCGIWAAVILILLVVAGISWQAGSQAGYSSGFEDGVESSADVLNADVSVKCKNCLLKCNYVVGNKYDCLSNCDMIC